MAERELWILICFLRLLLLSSFFLPSQVIAEGLADAIRGKVVASVRCGPCHHLNSNYMKVGPGLLGIYGKSPTIQGMPFEVWDDDSLQAWLINPRAVKANTRMVLPKMSERDRNDIIAWLAVSQP
ncbi:MAG: c-type cytochrome [Mariprofundaceae bacterium]